MLTNDGVKCGEARRSMGTWVFDALLNGDAELGSYSNEHRSKSTVLVDCITTHHPNIKTLY
jgi:hypothetical protein